ncbi:MAG: hypothetical protein JW731_09165 [Bacteroidales bacterium]|nr:hypothetical protein [Bacteroidales bacterium]
MEASNHQTGQNSASQSAGKSQNRQTKKFRLWAFLIGIYLLVISIILTYIVFQLWPDKMAENSEGTANPNCWIFFGYKIIISAEARLILLVLAVGALGSFIHGATSFISFVGNNKLEKSWTWWYFLRPFIGGVLALIFYFVIRAGFLSAGSGSEDISIFGITAISGLVGMFSKNAIDKLEELFKTLFKTEKGAGDDARQGKLTDDNPVTQFMIPFSKIVPVSIPEGKTEKDIKLGDIYHKFTDIITRIPIFDHENHIKYIIHQSLLYKYIAADSVKKAESGETFLIGNLTLLDFLDSKGIRDQVEKSIAFVKKDATLKEAKEKMEKVKNCQDIFITETGEAKEPVLGWLPNTEIAKNFK